MTKAYVGVNGPVREDGCVTVAWPIMDGISGLAYQIPAAPMVATAVAMTLIRRQVRDIAL